MQICQSAVTLLSGRYLCISVVLLTVGACIRHTHTHCVWLRWTGSCKHEARETGRKGDLSVQLAFCSAGSNVACLPGGPLRQERVHRDPTGPPPSQTPDRGPVWKLYRDPITHHTAKLCSGHQMTSFLHLILRGGGGGAQPQRETLGCHSFKILHCYLHICGKMHLVNDHKWQCLC